VYKINQSFYLTKECSNAAGPSVQSTMYIPKLFNIWLLFCIRILSSGQWALSQMLQLPVKEICSLLMCSRKCTWIGKHCLCTLQYILDTLSDMKKLHVFFLNIFSIFISILTCRFSNVQNNVLFFLSVCMVLNLVYWCTLWRRQDVMLSITHIVWNSRWLFSVWYLQLEERT